MVRSYESKSVGRSPLSTSEAVSRSMKSNKAYGTKPELVLAHLLRKKIVQSKLPGSPDFVYPRLKLVVFVQGCFWHRCPIHSRGLPKTNTAFWRRKFARNIERDRLNRKELQAAGWKVIEVWEHEINEDRYLVAKRIRRATASFK